MFGILWSSWCWTPFFSATCWSTPAASWLPLCVTVWQKQYKTQPINIFLDKKGDKYIQQCNRLLSIFSMPIRLTSPSRNFHMFILGLANFCIYSTFNFKRKRDWLHVFKIRIHAQRIGLKDIRPEVLLRWKLIYYFSECAGEAMKRLPCFFK